MADSALAVERVRPCCPVCGDPLNPPADGANPHMTRPTSLYVPLQCHRGHWQGEGKFWTRQHDELLNISG